MTSGKRIWRQLSTSLVIAIGIALVWGILVGWGGAVVEKILWPMDITHEHIVLTAQGTPLIITSMRFVSDDQYSQTYRTLDGQSATVRTRELLNGQISPAPVEPPGLWYLPLAWKYRVAGISDLGKPQVGWCLIRDDQPSGQAYLVGYEMKTKQFVGTIGRNGFCSSLPPEEERFEHDGLPYGWMKRSNACTSGHIFYGRAAPRHSYNQIDFYHDIPQWLLFLIDGDRLQEIDLRSRKVRTLFQSPDLVGVSLLTAKDNSAEDGNKRAVHRLLARLTDRVVILDRTTGDKQEYLLPDSMLRQQLFAYALDDGQLLLVSSGAVKEGRKQVKLVWFSPDGQTAQEKVVSLFWIGQSMSKHAQVVVTGLAAPIPFAWTVGGGIVGPLTMMQRNDVPDYSAGLKKAITKAWPGLAIAVLLALASAGIALGQHRKYHRPRPGLWWWFVFLLGPAGLLAYWLGHRRTVLEPCPSCGRIVPRDRDGCAACSETFAAPELLGTEVYA